MQPHSRKQVELKFIYSENVTKFCEIFTLVLTTVHTVKSKVKFSQNFVTFSEYMNFKVSEIYFHHSFHSFAIENYELNFKAQTLNALVTT